MQVIKKIIFSMLLLSASSTYCSDPGSMAVMAVVSVINFAIQSGKDVYQFRNPTAEKKLSDAVAERKLKYTAAEEELNAINVEEELKYAVAKHRLNALIVAVNLEYAQAKDALDKCLQAREGIIERDKDGFPVGCEKEARAFVARGGREEMEVMIDNINRSRV